MIKRTIEAVLKECIENKPIALITGSRQVGKTTLCYEIAKQYNFNYVSLDDIHERKTAIEDPDLFLKLHQWSLIIDDIQYAPELFPIMQSIVNKEKMTSRPFEINIEYNNERVKKIK